MKWLQRHDLIYLVLAILLVVTSAAASHFFVDQDIGWVLALFSVLFVVTQFMYVYELRKNTSILSDYIAIRDKFLRQVVERKLDSVQELARKAGREDKVILKLDDLFEFVTQLVEVCEKLECVDIRTERWDSDPRAIQYFEANRRAIDKRRAEIYRIFVFNSAIKSDLTKYLSTQEETEDIKKMRTLLRDQKDAGITVAFIFSNQAQLGDVRDFGIFDDKRVLDENFDGLGNSTYEGFISSVPSDVAAYKQLWSRLESRARENKSMLDALLLQTA